jgi:hypothetical protein
MSTDYANRQWFVVSASICKEISLQKEILVLAETCRTCRTCRIDKEIAIQGNLASSKEIERNFKILQIVSFNLKNKQQIMYISLWITGKVFLNLIF